MKEISLPLRIAVIQALTPFTIGGIQIPIFDEFVNPSVNLPAFMGGKAYVVIRDQQEVETTNDKCQIRQNALITVDCIVKFPSTGGTRTAVESLSTFVMDKIVRGFQLTDWNVLNVTKVNSRTLIEQGASEIAYRKLITYSFDVYEK
jgi:hypothetical protein